LRVILDSEVPVTDKVFEILAYAKDKAGVTEEIELIEDYRGTSKRMPVLALGNVPVRAGCRTVEAPSGASIVTRADSVTRLSRAFKLIVDPPVFEPIDYAVLGADHQDFFEALVHKNLGKRVVIDIEVSGCIEEDLVEESNLISVAFTYDGEHCYVLSEEILTYAKCARIMGTLLTKNKVIAHNGKFDLKYLEYYAGIEQTNYFFDTMLAHYILYPAATGQHGLKNLAKRLFGADDWEEDGKKYLLGKTYPAYGIEYYEDGTIKCWHDARKYKGGAKGNGYERIHRNELYEYNAYDVYWTWHLFEHFEQEVNADSEAQRVFAKRMQLSDMFQEVETPGWRYDIDKANIAKQELEYEAIQLAADLAEIAGMPINPNSPAQVKKWFSDRGETLPFRKSKDKNGKSKSAPSSNEDALKEVLESEAYSDTAKDFARKLLECRGNTKNLGTYINGFLEAVKGERIYTSFNIIAASTYRLSTPKPALMTIPRDKRFRGLVLPDEGQVFVKPDYSQIEWRVMAVLSGDEYLRTLFQKDSPDPFDALMPTMFPHVDVNNITAAQKKEYRTKEKTVIYGLSFGRKAQAIAAELGMPWYEAQNIIDNYMEAAYDLDAWRQEIMRKAVEGEEIRSIFGCHFQQEVVTTNNKTSVENQALAFLPQSTANDVCLEAALRIHPQLKQYGARIVATVHDQILASSPIECAKEVGEMMEYEMVSAAERNLGTDVAFDAEPEYGFSWAEEMNPQQWDEWLQEKAAA